MQPLKRMSKYDSFLIDYLHEVYPVLSICFQCIFRGHEQRNTGMFNDIYRSIGYYRIKIWQALYKKAALKRAACREKDGELTYLYAKRAHSENQERDMKPRSSILLVDDFHRLNLFRFKQFIRPAGNI